MRGVRARLTPTLVALVVLTAAVLGIASYVFVDVSLHDQVKDDAAIQAGFDLSDLISIATRASPRARRSTRAG